MCLVDRRVKTEERNGQDFSVLAITPRLRVLSSGAPFDDTNTHRLLGDSYTKPFLELAPAKAPWTSSFQGLHSTNSSSKNPASSLAE